MDELKAVRISLNVADLVICMYKPAVGKTTNAIFVPVCVNKRAFAKIEACLEINFGSKMSAVARLGAERKAWRIEHPLALMAHPSKNPDGTLNLFAWDYVIPGKKRTAWANGLYKLRMTFNGGYPDTPPKCRFDPPIFHPNVFGSGTVCLSLLDEEKDWRPEVTIKQILEAIQNLLHRPNIAIPAQNEASSLFHNNLWQYNKRVQFQAREMAAKK